MRKILIFASILFLLTFVSANSITIEFPKGEEFSAGDPITFKATLYDDSQKPIDGEINIIIEDSQKSTTTASVKSGDVNTITIVGASSGQGVIKADYQGTQTIAFFEIGRQEIIKFELDTNNNLVATNIGNTPYSKIITITIGSTTGTQEVNLEVGQSKKFRLIAPDGNYNIKVTDGKTTLIRGDIKLTGTGNVVGAIDESATQNNPITGIVSPDGKSDTAILSYIKRSKFVYVFIAVIFAAMILVAIERNYRRKV